MLHLVDKQIQIQIQGSYCQPRAKYSQRAVQDIIMNIISVLVQQHS